jgi:OmpA-OmpF porin, OOP family
MNRLLLVGLMAVAVSLGGPASAAEKPGQWYVSPMASVIWVDDNRLTDDDVGLALALGYAINDAWNVEFHAFGYKLEGFDDTDYWGGGVDLMHVFYRSGRISPYLLAGAGWNRKQREFGPDNDNLYVNGAFGFITDLVPNGAVALRTELRYRHDDQSPNLRDLMLNVGLQIPFGSPRTQPVPVAEPPPPPPPPPVPGDVITLEGIEFGFDSDRITRDERGALDSAAETLRRNPGLRVEIAGHTDSVGAAAYNQALSERRARAVLEYLVAAGIDRDRLTARGYGEAEPVADNATDAGRARNRRVELRVLE